MSAWFVGYLRWTKTMTMVECVKHTTVLSTYTYIHTLPHPYRCYQTNIDFYLSLTYLVIEL